MVPTLCALVAAYVPRSETSSVVWTTKPRVKQKERAEEKKNGVLLMFAICSFLFLAVSVGAQLQLQRDFIVTKQQNCLLWFALFVFSIVLAHRVCVWERSCSKIITKQSENVFISSIYGAHVPHGGNVIHVSCCFCAFSLSFRSLLSCCCCRHCYYFGFCSFANSFRLLFQHLATDLRFFSLFRCLLLFRRSKIISVSTVSVQMVAFILRQPQRRLL